MKVKREGLVSEYITDALLMLIKKKPYADISITELCQKAGVTRMSFYRNFESKEDILAKWTTEITKEFLTHSGIDYKKDSITAYFTKLFTHMAEQKELCLTLRKAGLVHLIQAEFDREIRRLHEGEYGEYKSAFLSGGIFSVFVLWLSNDFRESPEALAAKLEELWVK